MEKGDHFVLNAVAQAIYDKKGMNILALDVRSCSSLTDYVIIAEGLATKHVIALSHAVEKSLSELGYKAFHMEGQKIGDWVVIDYMQESI